MRQVEFACADCPTGQFVMIPMDVLKGAAWWALSSAAQRTYVALRMFTHKGRGPVRPSNEALARAMRCSTRTVYRGLHELEAAGLITIQARPKPRRVGFVGEEEAPAILEASLPEPVPTPPEEPDLFQPTVPDTPEPAFLPPPEDERPGILMAAGVDPPVAARLVEAWPTSTPEDLRAIVASAHATPRILDKPAWIVVTVRRRDVPPKAITRTPAADFHRAPVVVPPDGDQGEIARSASRERIRELEADFPDIVRDCRARAVGRPDSLLYARSLIHLVESALAEQGRHVAA